MKGGGHVYIVRKWVMVKWMGFVPVAEESFSFLEVRGLGEVEGVVALGGSWGGAVGVEV